MNLASVLHLLETRDEQIKGPPISLSHFGQFYDAHFRFRPKELSVELPFHLLQLYMEFFGNVVYQVNDAPVKELGNNISLK